MTSRESIEAYAMVHHRYHPVVLRTAIELRKIQGDAFNSLFASKREMDLFFSALRNAKVIILEKNRIASGRRAPSERKNPCIEHFCRYPAKVSNYFSSIPAFLKFVQFVTTSDERMRSGSRMAIGDEKRDRRQTGDTPCFMLADRPVWARGVLNKQGRHVGNTFDMVTLEGFVFFMHEAFHVMQWYRSPLKLVLDYLRAVVRSLALSRGHIPWAHELIEFEVEAMVFHNKLWMLLDAWPSASTFLSRFGRHR